MAGVLSTRVGYSGGTKKNPTYYSLGDHTEVIQVTYDPAKVSYAQLLDVMFNDHGCRSKGSSIQYRSGVWYQDKDQKQAVEKKIAELKKGGPVSTHVASLGDFYRAEEYHQKYLFKRRS